MSETAVLGRIVDLGDPVVSGRPGFYTTLVACP
jgi:hypothetical protein